MRLFSRIVGLFSFFSLFTPVYGDQVFWCKDTQAVTIQENFFGKVTPEKFLLTVADDWSSAKIKFPWGEVSYGSCGTPLPVDYKDALRCSDDFTSIFWLDKSSKKYTLSRVSIFHHIYPGGDGSGVYVGSCEGF